MPAIALNASARPKRREKLFGHGRPRPLDREAKCRVMHAARALMRRTQAGRAYGLVSAKAIAVLGALLYGFHNARSGLCFPSYEKIAERAGCARSTVAEALKALETAGVLSWCNRLARIRQRCVNLLGGEGSRVRVIRTSNAYTFADPQGAADRLAIITSGNHPSRAKDFSKSENPTGSKIQDLPSLSPDLFASLERLKLGVFGPKGRPATA